MRVNQGAAGRPIFHLDIIPESPRDPARVSARGETGAIRRQLSLKTFIRNIFPIHRGAHVLTLNVNGKPVQVDADAEMPLRWLLRDVLHLTGTKYGCGMALCGACTVHLDGQPIRSCITPASAAVGKSVTTIEGLSQNGEHPVQRAWIELDVVQCGYCQSGQIMSAAALLAQNSKPTDAEIDSAMSGNVCRCGTYQRIRAAIKRAAENV